MLYLSCARTLKFSSVCLHLPRHTSIKFIDAPQTLDTISPESDAERLSRCLSPARTHHIFASGCSSVLMRLTIQLKRRPYKALDMASRTSAALSTVLVRMMVSPLVTTHWEVSASWSSSGPMLRRDAAERNETVRRKVFYHRVLKLPHMEELK